MARKPGKPATPEAVAQRVALICAEPSGEATHWTGPMMAKATGLSLRTVQRIWAAHNRQLHRIRIFKRSRDPKFIAELADAVPPVPIGQCYKNPVHPSLKESSPQVVCQVCSWASHSPNCWR